MNTAFIQKPTHTPSLSSCSAPGSANPFRNQQAVECLEQSDWASLYSTLIQANDEQRFSGQKPLAKETLETLVLSARSQALQDSQTHQTRLPAYVYLTQALSRFGHLEPFVGLYQSWMHRLRDQAFKTAKQLKPAVSGQESMPLTSRPHSSTLDRMA
ncbi:MAG: hypothetical protein SFZ03_11355 [Candidatus Melainabacteria bacterium]|nr:hypothetical protein [Candidatus Melainabacteria bacterium]